MSQRDARVVMFAQDQMSGPRNDGRSRQIEDSFSKDLPAVPSLDRIQAGSLEEHAPDSRDESMTSFRPRDSPNTTRHVISSRDGQKNETNRSSAFQPNVFTTSLHIPSPVSHRKLPGIVELNLPTTSLTTLRIGNNTVATQLPMSVPAQKPSHLPPKKRGKPASDSQVGRRRKATTTSNTLAEDVADNTRRTPPDALFLCDSETEEELGPPARSSAGGSPARRETAEATRREMGDHAKRVEVTRPRWRNHIAVDSSEVRRPAQKPPAANDAAVNRSGSFSIPARTTYVSQLRPGPLVLDGLRRTPSPGGYASRRPEISPRGLVSTISMISLDGRPSRIPRLVQWPQTSSAHRSPRSPAPRSPRSPAPRSPRSPVPRSPRSPVPRSSRSPVPRSQRSPGPISPRSQAPSPAPCPPVIHEVRYSVYNVFTVVMAVGCDEYPDPLNILWRAIVADASYVDGYVTCDTRVRKSYVQPAVQKMATYDPVRLSTKPSEIISAVVLIEEPKVFETLSSVKTVASTESTDKHIIQMTEFQDAVRVFQPVVPTSNAAAAAAPKRGCADGPGSEAQWTEDRATAARKIISLIPPVVLANARVKKQKRSKSVQSKAKPSVQHAVQCMVHPTVHSTLLPGVQTSLPTMVRSAVRPLVRSSVQHVIQCPAARPAANSTVLPAEVRPPTRKTSSLVSAIVEVSFTDLDRKAFEPRRLTTASYAEPSHTAKKQNPRDADRAANAAKMQSKSESSREGILNSASRSALKAIVRAILANSGVQLPPERPANRRDLPERAAPIPLRPTQAKSSSTALVSKVPAAAAAAAAQRRNWSLDEVKRPANDPAARQDRAPHRSQGGYGQNPLGSSVTQVFSRHRKEQQNLRHHSYADDDTDTSWSKALYAKTLYFKKQETRENSQKQTVARNALSSGYILPQSTTSGWSESPWEDPGHSRIHFHSTATMPNILPSFGSPSARYGDSLSSLEQTVSNLLLNRFDQFQPIRTWS